MTERTDNLAPSPTTDGPCGPRPGTTDRGAADELDARAGRALQADFKPASGPTRLPKRLPPQDRPQRSRREWAVAACLLLAIGVGVLVRHLGLQGSQPHEPTNEPVLGAVTPADEPLLLYDQAAPAPDSHDHVQEQVYQQRYIGVRDEQTGEVYLICEDTVQTQRDSLAMDM